MRRQKSFMILYQPAAVEMLNDGRQDEKYQGIENPKTPSCHWDGTGKECIEYQGNGNFARGQRRLRRVKMGIANFWVAEEALLVQLLARQPQP